MIALALACATGPTGSGAIDTATPGGDSADSAEPGDSQPPATYEVDVLVTLDGEPAAGVTVGQSGGAARWSTGDDGHAVVTVDPAIAGGRYVFASHPDAWITGQDVEDETTATIALERFSRVDNEAYTWADPGVTGVGSVSDQCVHCHDSIHVGWRESPHAQSARNVQLHDLYQGIAQAFADDASCRDANGTWSEGTGPGTGETAELCFVGQAAPAENNCADCHAPAIDGARGGRDLLDATGWAYEYGVTCDVCHKVESIDLSAPPGVAGRLGILRPSDPSPSEFLGEFHPQVFGPYDDVIAIVMGAVQRDLFHQATLCAGCHQEESDLAADRTRWPSGRLPIHTTYAEWEAGPLNPSGPCQSCHMPPLPGVGNAADLGNISQLEPNSATGWLREPGAVRAHTWVGPRTPESGMLQNAALLQVETRREVGEIVVDVTVQNVGAGHNIPTGEPMRAMLLQVDASCDDAPLTQVGGSVVPGFGGYRERREAGSDWTSWPSAEPGDVIRVIRRTGAWYDYSGFGPFGDGTFDSAQKGMPVEEWLGDFAPGEILPSGDLAYLVRENDHAGAPGFGFARVTVGADGERGVPGFRAVDIASDNRLAPRSAWTSTVRFDGNACPVARVGATLLHRNYATPEAARRGWTITDQVMAAVEVDG